MVDGFNMGGSAGGVDIVCIYDEEPSVDRRQLCDRRDELRRLLSGLLLLEPDA